MSPQVYRLFTPGPTEIPQAVQNEMVQPMMHHRTPQFEAIFAEAQSRLKQVYQTKNDVIMLAASGTGSMDACVCNFFSPGETILVIRTGKFGDRWRQLAETYQLTVELLDYPPGVAADPNAVADKLQQNTKIAGVLMQASETSTGTYHPVDTIAKVIREKTDALIIVDGVTAIGIHDVQTDQWGLDCVVAGSQKGFMLPPGLSFIAVSERAWQKAAQVSTPRFYLNLLKERQSQQKNTTAFTPAVSLIRGLNVACEIMLSEGLAQLFKRHTEMTKAMHAAANELGLQLVAKHNPSHCLTAMYIPETIGAGNVKKHLETEHNMIIAGGQDELKGKIIRIAHFGALTPQDVLLVAEALETTLATLGMDVAKGQAKQAAAAMLR